MQLKITMHLLLITCWITSLKCKSLYSKGCFECEEEIWEEVPCEDIPSYSTTVSVSHKTTSFYKPTKASTKHSTSQHTTTLSPNTTTTHFTTSSTYAPSKPYATTTSPAYTTAVNPYKKCYCECKVGCKEFCRKVVFNSPEKQIVQVAKMSQPVKNGRFESTHFLQREFIPNSDYIDNKPAESLPKYKEYFDLDAETYTGDHNKLSFPTVVEPIYHNTKVKFSPHPYHGNYGENAYDFSIPFDKIFSTNSKALLNPVESVSISLDDNPTYSSFAGDKNFLTAKVKKSQTFVNNNIHYDDSFDSLIKKFLTNTN